MTQEYQPTSNFYLDFNRSIQSSVAEFDMVYDSQGTTAALIDTFAAQLSQTNGYASERIIRDRPLLFKYLN